MLRESMTDSRSATDTHAPADATRQVFEEYAARLHRFLARRLPSAHDAQDLAQEVYLRFMQVSRQEEIRNPQAFLYRLASNMVYEFRVRERYNRVVFDSDEAEKRERSIAEDMSIDLADEMNFSQEFKRVLEELPKPLQAVLLLRKCAGYSPDEIAQQLGFTKSTVYAYLIRAVAHFKA